MSKVGIVHENMKAQSSYQKFLVKNGYDVVFTATDGADALDKNRKSPANIMVIWDVRGLRFRAPALHYLRFGC